MDAVNLSRWSQLTDRQRAQIINLLTQMLLRYLAQEKEAKPS